MSRLPEETVTNGTGVVARQGCLYIYVEASSSLDRAVDQVDRSSSEKRGTNREYGGHCLPYVSRDSVVPGDFDRCI